MNFLRLKDLPHIHLRVIVPGQVTAVSQFENSLRLGPSFTSETVHALGACQCPVSCPSTTSTNERDLSSIDQVGSGSDNGHLRQEHQ